MSGTGSHEDEYHDTLIEMLGCEKQARFLENWRAMQTVLDKGELRPGFYRARTPR